MCETRPPRPTTIAVCVCVSPLRAMGCVCACPECASRVVCVCSRATDFCVAVAPTGARPQTPPLFGWSCYPRVVH
uniref:Putative secreted protein n=1 Tax=Anopheles darlingi TaxID=43151 RepID=A0A2M4DPY0_ANODA